MDFKLILDLLEKGQLDLKNKWNGGGFEREKD